MSKAASSKRESLAAVERRRTRRRPIIGTFSLFCVVPRKGPHRLQVHDVSEEGIGFDLDTEGEDAAGFAVKSGEPLGVHFYLNQSLYLPLALRVMRVEERNPVRRVGAELDTKDKGYAAYLAFVKMLDAIVNVARIG